MTEEICPTCKQPIGRWKPARICALCQDPILKTHKWRINGSQVEHRVCARPGAYHLNDPEDPV